MSKPKFDFVDGQTYKLASDWMIFQMPDAYEEEDYTKEQIDLIVEKYGIGEDPVAANPVIIPTGTEFKKLPDSEKCKNEKSVYWKELEFILADTDIVVKLNLRCPYMDSWLQEILIPA